MSLKLYRITLHGMISGVIGTKYGHPYVVAEDASAALKKVQDYLRNKDIGFRKEREMESIELLAEEGDYPDCRYQLFL